MASEMQERVARAIEEAAKDCDDPAAYYRVVALAAMEAMREPTQVMMDAAPASYSESFQAIWPKVCGELWGKMLAAEIEAAKQP
jgi:hypothetical protein